MNKWIYPLFVIITTSMLVGCGEPKPVANIAYVTNFKSSLKYAMSSAKGKAADGSNELNSAYTQLKIYLSNNNLSNSEISTLEQEYEVLKRRGEAITTSFKNCKNEGKELFDLLERRAKENKTRTLRKRLLKDISKKESEFGKKIKSMERLADDLNDSIQRYDDILGYFQVNKGLAGIDNIISDIDSTIADSIALNNEINQKISEGLAIINSL